MQSTGIYLVKSDNTGPNDVLLLCTVYYGVLDA
jgi:hypothetical protein